MRLHVGRASDRRRRRQHVTAVRRRLLVRTRPAARRA